MRKGKSVIIVEDEAIIAEYFRIIVEDAGATVIGIADNGDDALKLIRQQAPDFVLMDVRLRGKMDGIDVAITMHQEFPDSKIIYITGSTEQSTVDRMKRDHPYRILIKPIEPDDLREAIE